MTEKIVAYIGAKVGDGMGGERFGSTSRRYLTDWHGKRLGYCKLGTPWATPRSYVGSQMYPVYATIDGREYYGRSFGENMAVVLRETAASRRSGGRA